MKLVGSILVPFYHCFCITVSLDCFGACFQRLFLLFAWAKSLLIFLIADCKLKVVRDCKRCRTPRYSEEMMVVCLLVSSQSFVSVFTPSCFMQIWPIRLATLPSCDHSECFWPFFCSKSCCVYYQVVTSTCNFTIAGDRCYHHFGIHLKLAMLLITFPIDVWCNFYPQFPNSLRFNAFLKLLACKKTTASLVSHGQTNYAPAAYRLQL